MSTQLVVGNRGIDYSYARPSLPGTYSAGGRFVVRYSAGAASAPGHPSHALNAGKLITPAEHKAILAAGLDVIANDEWYTTRITEGSTAGREDGLAALHLWQSCGHAKGASIYVSYDAAPVSNTWSAVANYLTSYQAALGGYYHVDTYAGTPLLRWLLARHLIRYGWRPNAGTWSGDGLPYQPSAAQLATLVKTAQAKTPAAIWQTGNYWWNKTADENVLLRAMVGSHLQAAALNNPTPKPAPAPTPAPDVTPTGKPGVLRDENDPSLYTVQVMPDGSLNVYRQGEWIKRHG